ncbi:MAG TPA: EAL domain-containing protein [Methylophilaceae bacterium]|nr:EAL domain-containing protein [Methylophilaceae bacterium]
MVTQNRQRILRLLTVALAYFVTGWMGLQLPYVGSHITLIWLPTGIAVAALLQWGYGCWLAIFLGAFAVNLSIGSSAGLAFSIAIGNTLAPLFSAWLLKHYKFKPAFNRMHDILLLLLAASIGMLLSASGGVFSLLQHGVVPPEHWRLPWLIWWLGDAVGVILVLPILLNISRSEWVLLWQRRSGYLLWCAIVSILEIAIFKLIPNATGQFALLSFLVLPLVIWTAMRFGITGASLAVLGLSIIAVLATVNFYGPFYQQDLHQGILSLWIFMTTLALVVLMITVLQSERSLAELALRSSEARFRAVVDGALDAVVTIDESGCLVEFNPAAERIFGYTKQQVIGRPLAEVIIPPSMRKAHSNGHQHFLRTGEHKIFDQRLEMTAMRSDGTEFPVELTITSLKDKGLPLVTGFIRDITKRKLAEENIRNLAFFDALTGLPNRRLLMDRLQQAFATSARAQTHGAVLFIDLDNFKSLNDTRGHDIGDLLLMEVPRRIRTCLRDEDTVARLGGDEFVVVLEDLSLNDEQAASEARIVSEKILTEIDQPYMLGDMEHHSSSSIGVSLFMGYEVGVDDLLKRADTAMYQAKAAGRNTQRFFDPAMQSAIENRVDLEAQLRRALSQYQLCLYYQPQVDATRHIFGVEALIRWIHPIRGVIKPMEFIPIAEDSGLIIPIGNWVIHTACEQLKCWEQVPYAHNIQLAVNVSARQFRQADFVDTVKAALDTTGANPNLLKLELTESLVIDDVNDTIEKMHALRQLGVRFAMDDFGTGYSSLAYLKQLPLTQVKIDRSFVQDIANDASDASIVQAIIVMSKTLGLNVIAEGVETEMQFDLLAQYGCGQFQGYLFGKPVELAVLDKILHENRLLFPDN